MKHFMIDLETMGTRMSSAIIAIGVVCFDLDKIIDSAYWRVNLDSNLRAGRTVDASTIIWWLGQSEEARAEFANQNTCLGIAGALEALQSFIKCNRDNGTFTNYRIWGNGSDFDCAMLADAYASVLKSSTPWHFATCRDLRTLRDMGQAIPRPPFENGVKHNALADALNQAQHAQLILRDLAAKGGEL